MKHKDRVKYESTPRCKQCKLRKRGANHAEGQHHKARVTESRP